MDNFFTKGFNFFEKSLNFSDPFECKFSTVFWLEIYVNFNCVSFTLLTLLDSIEMDCTVQGTRLVCG